MRIEDYRGLLVLLILMIVISCVIMCDGDHYDKSKEPIILEEEENIKEDTPISPIEELEFSISEEDINALARTLYGECLGVRSTMEKAAVAWVVCNRIDAGYGDTVLEVVSAPYQFTGYNPKHPLNEALVELAEDVLIRWHSEKLGLDSKRIIPQDYLWFHGDGRRNYFCNVYKSRNYWDWSLENPYED